MTDEELEKLPFKSLAAYRQRVEKIYQKALKAQTAAILDEARRKVADLGVRPDSVIPMPSKTIARPVQRRNADPKYRNPENPLETWTGRGRQPKWFVAAIAAGRSENDFLIK